MGRANSHVNQKKQTQCASRKEGTLCAKRDLIGQLKLNI